MPDENGRAGPRVDTRSARLAWDGYCADPFVLRTELGYFMYGTDPGRGCDDGRIFPVLSSPDTRSWTNLGGALEVPPGRPAGSSYWAPEVATMDGAYWMYYSSGVADSDHHLRVARADHPAGPFEDCGADLTPHLPFAIDPSPFRDVDGSWWLFFATDEVSGPRPGTAIAVSRLLNPLQLDPAHRVVLRATQDWQRYERNRLIYGAVHDWHTLEGPFVVRRGEIYWLFFSGGNWQEPGYGVAAARAHSPAGPWEIVGDGPSVLSTDVTTGLRGPGHNCVCTTLEGGDLAVFHSWDTSALRRRPYLAAVEWSGSD